jgi:hypothetical protein
MGMGYRVSEGRMSAQLDKLFLTPGEIDELTGIRRGSKGRTKFQMQSDYLFSQGIPHRMNARNRPVVTLSAIEGRKTEAPRPTWQPTFVNHGPSANHK